MDGRAVGQPGRQVNCRSQGFFVYPRGSDVWTQCCACGAQEDAKIRRTTQRQQAGTGALACERCNGAMFALYEEGNEVQTKCLNDQCGYFMALGVGKSLR
jgi:hypothetical protein